MLLSTTETCDVGAMRPEDEERDDDADEHGERDRHLEGREGEEDTRSGGNPFPAATKSEKDRPDVARNRGDAAGDGPDDGIARADDARRKKEHRERALQRVEQEDGD